MYKFVALSDYTRYCSTKFFYWMAIADMRNFMDLYPPKKEEFYDAKEIWSLRVGEIKVSEKSKRRTTNEEFYV